MIKKGGKLWGQELLHARYNFKNKLYLILKFKEELICFKI